METMSAADIAAVTRNDRDGFGFGDEGLWLFAILALMGGGNGLFGNRSGGNPVTEADLCNANSFSELKGSVGRLSDQVSQMYTGLQNGLCNLGYTNLQSFNALERQLADCCCTTQRAVDGVRFDMANYAAGTNAAISAGIQKVLDRLCADKEASMAARIQQLELQQAVCGVVRYPTATTYATNCNPFFGGCGCGVQSI